MTTGREDTRTRRAVVVGTDRPAAAAVFGDGFDHLLTTTYAELASDLGASSGVGAGAGTEVGFIGVAAGAGMQDAVDAALAFAREAEAAGGPVPVVAVEIPWDLSAVDHLRDRLRSPGAPVLSEVRRYRDRPCVVLGGAPAPVHDPAWVLDAVLTAGTTAPDARVSEQQRVAAEWEHATAMRQVQRKDQEIQRLRQDLAQARERLHGEPAPKARPGRGARAGAAAPAAPSSSGGLRGRLAALARAVPGAAANARAGALILALGALVALGVPALVLGIVAGRDGVAVGLGTGVVLLGLAAVGLAVLVAHRSALGRLDRLQGRLERETRTAQEREARLDRRTTKQAERQLARLDAVATSVEAVPGKVRGAVRNDGVVTRRQVQALLNLLQIVPLRASLPPLGGWAASPDLVLEVVDRLLAERPRLVVELGSGASTAVLALAVREHGLDTRIVSLDHNAHYAARTRELLERHGVADLVDVRFAPLARTHVPDHLTPWYDEAAIADLQDVGMIVVDGPPKATGPAARYPAIPLLAERLAPRCCIVVDDTVRPDDRAVVTRWAEQLPDFAVRDLPLEKGAVVLQRG
ncbi:MAG TPA: class I SAM-dependent methyltransferase [Nocardioides sp.]|nr:class I SAM-dependent methyltransferase [Nocardioides sp.]